MSAPVYTDTTFNKHSKCEREGKMFTKKLTLFSLFGFPVRVDLSWIVIAVLVVWSLSVGLFPRLYSDLSQAAYLWMGIAGALGLFVSIIVHEFAHSKVAQSRGLPMKGITLFIFGGVAEMTDEPPDPGTEFRVAVAGPIASIAIAACCFGLEQLGKSWAWPVTLTGILRYLWWINLILVAFNAVPAFPLDGGRVLRSILWKTKGSLKKATHTASTIGSGFGIVLMIAGGISFITGNFVGGMWWVVIGMFLRGAARMSYQQLLVRRALEGERTGRFMKSDPVTVSPNKTVDEFVNDYVYRYHHKLYPVVQNKKLIGCLHTKDIREIPKEEWPKRKIGDLAQGCSDFNSISLDQDATKALSRMRKNDVSRLMVLDGGHLVGVVTLKDMLEFLSLKIELEEE
jgi:Zn-dependent protease/CBS domain-containing protein